MVADMKFEESSLTGFLIKNLEPLTEADPAILAEYIIALLKKEKPTNELQKLCTENLVEFLRNDTKSFIEKLFQALEDGSLAPSSTGPDPTNQIEHPMTTAHVIDNSASPKERKDSSPSGHLTDSEDKEASEDDDDDRNHKHRRRESLPFSLDKDVQESKFKRPNRKRKPFESGQMFLDTGSQFHNVPSNPSSSSDNGKFEKRRTGLAAVPRAPQDFNQKTSGPQAFCGPRFDQGRLSIGRGRGRTGSWSQHDSRFGSVGALDYAPQMAHLAPTASLFGTTAQNPSWGPFGLIHGVPNSGLDGLHPLGLPGTLQPQINPSLTIGIPRQRCRDFEERGFCLRGDMCPMEHGVNRIVVEDVQSLSQFNLPVSLPSARVHGVQGGTGPLPPASTASSSLLNTKVLQSRNYKVGAVDDGISTLNGVFSGTAAGGDSDLYDPDQPLWTNKLPETSCSVTGQPSKIDYKGHVWNTVSSDNKNDNGHSSKGGMMSQGASSSIQDRSRSSRNKLEKTGPSGSTGDPENETSEYRIQRLKDPDGIASPRDQNEEVGVMASTFTSTKGPRAESGHDIGGKGGHGKASRTLYVSGIPSENNKRGTLFSHFQKFGLVLDIYIPQNSNKAFVQFATREEAEAALKAPDAVMGNRFIKLWWANRDNIPDEVVNSMNAGSSSLQPVSATSISPKPIGVAAHASSTKTGLSQKISVESGPKVTPPSQKQLETLELMRKKQELLEQKRNALQRQLDNFKKQATVKGDSGSELAVKGQKVDTGACNVKATSCAENLKTVTREGEPEAEKILDGRCSSGDNTLLPATSKAGSAIQLQSPKSLKQPNRFPVSSFPINRYKLDNRPTAFGVLPPLPPELANVVVLKAHFSSFGDLASVELEDAEATDVDPSDSKPSQKYAARVVFTTRRSAERAFFSGRCLRGHSLNFTWLITTSNVKNSRNGCNENSCNATSILKPTVEVETRNSGSSSSSTGKSSSSVIPNGTSTKGGKSQLEITESTSGGLKSMDEDLDEASSSCNKQAPKADIGLAH